MFGGYFCARNSLVVLNIFYVTIGVVLIALGAYFITSNRVVSLPIIGGVVACGVFLLLVALGGIYATLKQHQVMLFFYAVILFCIFIIQFSIASACLGVSKETQQGFAEHGWKSVEFDTKRTVQDVYQCCAFKQDRRDLNASVTDPFAHPSCESVHKCMQSDKCKDDPKKCCTDETNCSCPPCSTSLENVIGKAFRVSGGVSLFFSFTEICGIWFTMKYRNLRNPSNFGNPSAFL